MSPPGRRCPGVSCGSVVVCPDAHGIVRWATPHSGPMCVPSHPLARREGSSTWASVQVHTSFGGGCARQVLGELGGGGGCRAMVRRLCPCCDCVGTCMWWGGGVPFPTLSGGYAGDDLRRKGATDTSAAHTATDTMRRACTSDCFVSTKVTCHTGLQPHTRDPSNLLHIHACYDVSIRGTSSLLFFPSEVYFDPWGLHARHAANLPPGGPTDL